MVAVKTVKGLGAQRTLVVFCGSQNPPSILPAAPCPLSKLDARGTTPKLQLTAIFSDLLHQTQFPLIKKTSAEINNNVNKLNPDFLSNGQNVQGSAVQPN
ncbi:hypothetical protein Q8A67_010867 [Cirrhinus molitorella]|uniref:Uncharacterized protein n=1 Tax=Cirrhinus molitorella TaxID=172907 RepID=A0AA88TXI2_9TELE|nr:hypothetical protein Q8A67_010867 [Cirrhinus molitorella]